MSKSIEHGSKAPTDTSAIHSRQRIIQNFLLIWIDTNIDKSTVDYQNTVIQLRNVVNDINVFTELDEAVDFLTDVDEVKVFLIVDGTVG